MRLPLLALLAREPAHGCELKTQLGQVSAAACPAADIGQAHLALQQLERAGLHLQAGPGLLGRCREELV